MNHKTYFFIDAGDGQPYTGFFCGAAGIEHGVRYETKEDAISDLKKLTRFNPVKNLPKFTIGEGLLIEHSSTADHHREIADFLVNLLGEEKLIGFLDDNLIRSDNPDYSTFDGLEGAYASHVIAKFIADNATVYPGMSVKKDDEEYTVLAYGAKTVVLKNQAGEFEVWTKEQLWNR